MFKVQVYYADFQKQMPDLEIAAEFYYFWT